LYIYLVVLEQKNQENLGLKKIFQEIFEIFK